MINTGSGVSWRFTPTTPIEYQSKVEVCGSNPSSQGGQWKVNRGFPGTITVPGQGSDGWMTLHEGTGTLYNIDLSMTSGPAKWGGIRIDGKALILPQYSNNIRVSNVIDESTFIGVANPPGANFLPGQYLFVPEQRVAPWVLYEGDPTSRIDYLRRSRD